MSDGWQRQRHGPTKHLLEGIGGFMVGAAAVLLLTRLFGARPARAGGSVTPAPKAPSTDPAKENGHA